MRWTRRTLLSAMAAVPAAGALLLKGRPPRAAGPAPRLPIGMNLAGVNDYDPGYPFLNAMWGARQWLTRNASGVGPWTSGLSGEVAIDGDGYPLEVPFTGSNGQPQIVFTILPNTLKPGKYVLLHSGRGTFRTEGQARIVAAEAGRLELFLKGGEQLVQLSITQSQRGDHVRDMRLLPSEHERADLDGSPFLPEFIAFCRPWHCLRFMDLLGTNNSIEQAWARRKRRTFYTQTGTTGDLLGIFGTPLPTSDTAFASGIALELCVEMANATGVDPWLCVPHLADDDYIRQMAMLVKARLAPGLKVYVEFSNELWNWSFLQAQWMLRSEIASNGVVALGGKPPWKGGKLPPRFRNGIVVEGAGQGTDHPERIAALQVRCFRIWGDVFTGPERGRLVRVCAVQSGWREASERTLNMVMRNGGCDAFAVGGYFGPDDAAYARWETAGARLTADDVVADMRKAVTREAAIARQNAEMARKAGVSLVVYEGGQHIQPKGQAEVAYADALRLAQTHPQMHDLYVEHLGNFAQNGTTLFCAYNSVGRQGTRFGSWGHVEHYGQSPAEAPKYRALLECNAQRAGGG